MQDWRGRESVIESVEGTDASSLTAQPIKSVRIKGEGAISPYRRQVNSPTRLIATR